MIRVIVESPYAGDKDRNVAYARACLLDSLKRGEAPLASHLLYTQVLDDDIVEHRKQGLHAGLAWYACASLSVVYTDLGISAGMARGVDVARSYSVEVEYRTLGAPWSDLPVSSMRVTDDRSDK